jgi:hypothetical protein
MADQWQLHPWAKLHRVTQRVVGLTGRRLQGGFPCVTVAGPASPQPERVSDG